MRRVAANIDVASLFGPFKLVPSQQLLLRGDQPVKVGGRALDILHLLVMRAGEEVSSNDLIAFAWPDVFVDKRNLKVHISSLRRALDDTFPQSTYIATVVGRGYQFVERVRTESVEAADFADVYRDEVPGGLPAGSLLVGRQRDVEGIAHLLDVASLVTLVGPGGVGKTSLAIAVAHARRGGFPDGVHFVDLSATDDPALVPHLLATDLGVRGDPTDLTSAIVEHLRSKRLLIVLDNCEHVRHAAATIAERFVAAKVGSRLLATSREALGILNEYVQRIEPLAFPKPAGIRSASEALAYPSVELFALRALETAEYQLVDSDAATVAELCRALDGLPLAIEIAAAKLDQFSPADLLASVGHSLGALGKDHADGHSRHQTLWATLDWSYQLLSAQEATMFRQASVFAGSFAGDDVANMARLAGYDPYQITVALGGLVAKSLLTVEIDGDQIRYRLLESAKCYAAEKLLEDPLAREAYRQHAKLLLSLFRQSEAEWGRADNRVWRTRYEARVGDLRKALDWCFGDDGEASLGVDLAVSAIRLWNEQSSIFEQLFQVERALTHCASMADGPQRQATLATSRAYSLTLGRRLRAGTETAWSAALDFAERSEDVGQRLSAMFGKALFLIRTGRNEQALGQLDELDRIAARANDRASRFDGERLRALAEMNLGELIGSRTRLEGLARELARGVAPSKVVRYEEERYVSIHNALAFSTWLMGQPELGLAMAEEVVAKTGQIGQLMGQSNVLASVAMPLALWSGRIDALERYARMLRSNLDRENIALWEPVHRFFASFGRHARGDRIAVDDMRSAIDELVRDRFMARTPMYLGVLAEAFAARGRAADADEAIDRALEIQRETGEYWCLPELLRVKATMAAARGRRDDAKAMLGVARDTALATGARSLEKRIAGDVLRMASNERHAGRRPSAILMSRPNAPSV